MSIKSELNKTTENLRRVRKAILGRGGDIEITAGLKDLPEAIFNIPADTSLSFYEDEEIAYQKTVPNGAEEYALLKRVGGMTYKCNNLFDSSNVVNTTYGTAEIDGNNLIITSRYFVSFGIDLKANTEYFIQGTTTGDIVGVALKHTDGTVSAQMTVLNRAFTPTKDVIEVYLYSGGGTSSTTTYSELMISKGSTALPYEPYYEGLRDTKVTEIVSRGANLFDASKIKNAQFEVSEDGSAIKLPIIGSNGYTGSKTTLDELCPLLKVGDTIVINFESNGANTTRSIYLAQAKLAIPRNTSTVITQEHLASEVVMYGTNVNKGDTEQVTITDFRVNLGTVSSPYTPYREPITYSIPEAVQALEGYGWGINELVYNYVDYGKKQFVKRVECVDMGALDWWYDKGGHQCNISNMEYTNLGVIPNIICSMYTNVGAAGSDALINLTDKSITTNYTIPRLYVVDRKYTDATSFKAAMSGVMLYYELATPIVTDISDILTNDNFLSVEGGGSLEFVNEHKYAVPSTIKYTVKVGG